MTEEEYTTTSDNGHDDRGGTGEPVGMDEFKVDDYDASSPSRRRVNGMSSLYHDLTTREEDRKRAMTSSSQSKESGGGKTAANGGKGEEEENEGPPFKKAKTTTCHDDSSSSSAFLDVVNNMLKQDGSTDVDIRLLISSKDAGAVIGKGGSNINHLRKHYKSSITVPDSPGPERVLSIGTKLGTLARILRDIMTYLDERPANLKDAEPEVELRLLVHASHAGGIIGRGGQRIKDLRDQTKAGIKVYTTCCPDSTERVIAISGALTTVIVAIISILDVILSTPVKGVIKLYDPFNFNTLAASEYGGFGDTTTTSFLSNTPTGPKGGNATVSADRPRGPTGHSTAGASQRSRTSSFSESAAIPGWQMAAAAAAGWASSRASTVVGAIPPPPPAHQVFPTWPHPAAAAIPPTVRPSAVSFWSDVFPEPTTATPPRMMYPSWGTGHHASLPPLYPSLHHVSSSADPENFVKNDDGTVSATLTVPNSIAGAIIGKGGSRIRLVRRDSGADISIDGGSGPGSDRKVSIKGSQEQVRMAYSMLQQSITENTR